MKKKRPIVLSVCLVLGLFAGCDGQTAINAPDPSVAVEASVSDAVPATDAKKITIGYTFQGLSDEYIVFLKDAVEAKSKELGVNILISDGQMSPEKQVSQVENFINQKVDVIVLNPISMDGCAPAVAAAKEANIPIITLISITSNQADATAYVGSDSVESGEIEMKMAAEQLGGKGKIAILFGQMGHDAQIGRYEGLKKVLSDYPEIEIVAEQTGNWSREEGMAIMENWLSSGMALNAVVAQNDAMAIGALKAIETKNLAGEILVFGIDAIPEALDAVEQGSMGGTVFQDAKGQGEKSVEVALEIAQGKQVEPNIYIPYVAVLKEDVPNYR